MLVVCGETNQYNSRKMRRSIHVLGKHAFFMHVCFALSHNAVEQFVFGASAIKSVKTFFLFVSSILCFLRSFRNHFSDLFLFHTIVFTYGILVAWW